MFLLIGIISHFLYWAHLVYLFSSGYGNRTGISYWTGRLTLALLVATLILTITTTKKEVLMWANIICGGIGLFLIASLFIDVGQEIDSDNFFSNISAPLTTILSFGLFQSNPGHSGFLPGISIAMLSEMVLITAGLIMVFRNRKLIINAASQSATPPLQYMDDGNNDLLNQLEKLASLREKGIVPEDIYNTEREKILLKMKT